jgi:hypothetical protein
MATDFHEPRKTNHELDKDSIKELKNRHTGAPSTVVDQDQDEAETDDSLDLPGTALSGERPECPGASRSG